MWLAAAALGLLLFGEGALAAGEGEGLSAAEARGRQIYRTGTSSHGFEVIAKVGSEAVALPASAVPCASCHGRDGRGRPEGGVIPPDIRWSELTKSYGHVHPDGRKHPAFDAASVDQLIRTGLDPAGNRVDASMPIYAMTQDDMADLIAYLERLEHDLDPGVATDRLQVATLLPLRGPQAETGQAMAQVLHGYFQDLNAQGGIFQRQLDLLVVPYGADATETLNNLRLALQQEGVFALVGPYTVGLDEPVLQLLREDLVPLVGPFTLDPGDEILNTGAFYIFSGLSEQARALAERALRQGGEQAPSLALVGPTGVQTDRLVAAVRDQLGSRGAAAPVVHSYPPGGLAAAELADTLAQAGTGALLFFGGQADLSDLLAALAERQFTPEVYLLGTFAYRALYDAPAGFDGRIYLAYPTLPQDISDAGRTEYQALVERHALPPDHIQSQVAALAAGKLLVEGLKRAGRELSRDRLEQAIEGLYEFQTGLTPPLTYGPTRRVGARGAHLMVVDLKAKDQRPVGPWLDLR